MSAPRRADALVRKTHFLYAATAEPPAFDLFQSPDIHRALYAGLAEHGLRLNDIRVENPFAASLGEVAIVCGLPEMGTRFRFRLDKVEIWSQDPQVLRGSSSMDAVVGAAVKAFLSATEVGRLATQVITTAFHAELQGLPAARWLSGYVAFTPDGEPTLTPSGVSFLSETSSPQMRGSLFLQESGEIEGGIHFGAVSEHPGSRPSNDAVVAAIDFAASGARRVGLQMTWGE